MGKAARQRVERSVSRPPAALYHGGAPGLDAGARILSAAHLGVQYEYVARAARYDRWKVYATTDVDVARAFAGKYVDSLGKNRPGDVYEVSLEGNVRPDEDYLTPISFRAGTGRVVRVVERGVTLTKAERAKILAPHRFWGSLSLPMYDADGRMLPSMQMKDAGVTVQYLSLLAPWTDLEDISGNGVPLIDGVPSYRAVLLGFPSLDSDHRIESKRGLLRTRVYTCACGANHQRIEGAIWHQLGAAELAVIGPVLRWWNPGTPISGWPLGHARNLVDEARRLSPERWGWVSL